MNKRWKKYALFAVALLAGAGIGWLLSPNRLAPSGGAGPEKALSAERQPMAGETPASRPSSSPAKYPSDELKEACKKAQKDLAEKLDDSFSYIVEPPFVAAGNMTKQQLQALVEADVLRPAEALYASYFKVRPDKVITVLLFADDKSYRSWAKKLFDDTDVSHFGYYKPDRRTMVMNIGTGGGTLIHELTHALIVYDFPDLPTWFNEGLASLHEGCYVNKDEIVGALNWRLPALQKAIADGKLRSLEDLVTKRDFYGTQQGINYAQARYFVMYMQHKGVLKDFYKYFLANHGKEGDDVKAIEHVFDTGIGSVERAYIKWVKALQYRQ
ncbi:MAG: hypothetical protein HZA50_06185 [Planctomycetes bacterium]|nr:hypothetical protein [Planctomycetota bacterium]